MSNIKFHLTPSRVSSVTVPTANEIVDKLPVGVYEFRAEKTQNGVNFYFQPMDTFTLPNKIYGNNNQYCKRVIKGYQDSQKNLGVLLNGVGGTGKSLLAKQICLESMDKLDLPVITVSSEFAQFVTYMFDILNKHQQNAVIFLDEYDKIFSDESSDTDDYKASQNKLLSIIDGFYDNKHLFLLTSNEIDLINDYLFNRPSRIRYMWEFGYLTSEFINEVVTGMVEDKERASNILSVLEFSHSLTFDNLVEFIKECLRNEDIEPEKLLDGFNINILEEDIFKFYDIGLTTYDERTIDEVVTEIFTKVLKVKKLSLTSNFNRVDRSFGFNDIKKSFYDNFTLTRYNYTIKVDDATDNDWMNVVINNYYEYKKSNGKLVFKIGLNECISSIVDFMMRSLKMNSKQNLTKFKEFMEERGYDEKEYYLTLTPKKGTK